MKRIIFGVGDSGKNTVLFQGAPRVMRGGDEELRASSEPPSEKIYLGWAASALDSSTSDYAAQIQDFNFKLNPGETRFLRVEIASGAESPMHRTPNITDYLVAVSGELTMYTEDGTSVKFVAGDMLVQLGGWHWYKNEGAEPFVMAGVVVGIETDEDVPFGVERRVRGLSSLRQMSDCFRALTQNRRKCKVPTGWYVSSRPYRSGGSGGSRR